MKQVRRLDVDEKGVRSTHTLGGEQKAVFVNEAGLYALVLGSRRPSARRFKRWVTHDVLPAIRRTGEYRTASTEDALRRRVELLEAKVDALEHRRPARLLARRADPWRPLVEQHSAGRDVVRVRELLEAMGVQRDRRGEMRAAAILAELGFARGQARFSGVKTRFWFRPDGSPVDRGRFCPPK